MKCLFLFPLIFLLLLSSTVSSQNPNMFEFTLSCHNQCRACGAIDLFNQAGQIISNNLVLNTKIKVYVVIYETLDTETLGGASPQITHYVDPEDGVTRIYPLALVRQLDPNFKLDTLDIIMEVNSRRDDAFWFPNGESIEPNELDFLEFVLHELHHGLGMKTSWNKYKDDSIGVGLIPDLDYYFDGATGKFTFDGFYETIFDKFLVSLRSGAMIKTYTKALNDMAGPQGRNYNDLNDFFTQLRDKQNQEGKSYTMDMLEIATNQNRLGFLITTDDDSVNAGEIASAAIPLETSYNPPVIGKSIEHLGYDDYYSTDDFLFIPVMETGFTLQEQITANGDYPGGGVGPSLFIMLESIGYKLRLPPRRRKPPATIAKINK